MYKINIYLTVLFSIIVFSILIYFLPGSGVNSLMIAITSVASFLFGIFLAFAIDHRQNRFNGIRSALRKDDALLLSIYKNSAVFGEKIQSEVKQLIDEYLIASIDYKLLDYYKSHANFNKLYDYFNDVKPANEVQIAVYSEIINEIKESSEKKKEINYLLNDRIESYEWSSLFSLGLIIMIALFVMNNDFLLYKFIVVLLGASIVLLLMILKQFDSLNWKEQSWIWQPLTELFLELDLVPYIPQPVLASHRSLLQKGITYRVAIYPNPYPDFKNKKIEIISN